MRIETKKLNVGDIIQSPFFAFAKLNHRGELQVRPEHHPHEITHHVTGYDPQTGKAIWSEGRDTTADDPERANKLFVVRSVRYGDAGGINDTWRFHAYFVEAELYNEQPSYTIHFAIGEAQCLTHGVEWVYVTMTAR